MRFSKFSILALGLMVSGAMLLTGCSDDDDNGVFTPAGNARVLVVHASPDAPAVDLLVNNNVAGSGLTFPNNTGYLEVAPGSQNVKVRATGTSMVVIDADLTLVDGTNYSVFAIDSLNSIEPLVVEDDLTTPASGSAHVRFVHLSPNAPAVDVAVTGGPILFPNTAFREYSNFTPVDAGSYDLEVRVAGTTTVALPLPNITLEAGNIYTVFARGFLGGAGSQALGAEIIVNN